MKTVLKLGLSSVFLALLILLVWPTKEVQAGDTCFCHLPPGNPENFDTICTSGGSADVHRDNHGDQPFGCECGDDPVCSSELGEDCSTCPQDCGACAACGDGHADAGEECGEPGLSCAGITNCGADGSGCICDGCRCAPLCVVDTVCNGSEDCNNCSADCGACPVCGDGQLDPGEQCDDGNTSSDDCCSATCQFETGSCDDDNSCTDGDSCSQGACVAGSPVTCNDHEDCTDDSCDPLSGCVFTNDDTNACTDNNVCTSDDACQSGSCVPGQLISCDDGDACTEASCDSVTGCQQAPIACTDGDTCTTDTCDSEVGCTFPPVSCDDGDACTDDGCDANSEGECAHTVHDCDDHVACTVESCNPDQGCVHAPDNDACDDGNECTDDTCDPTCTEESTDPACDPEHIGCRHTANIASCDDGNACTTGDSCSEGSCAGSDTSATDCNDQNGCTDDSCNSESGCQHTNNTASCSDGSECTTQDACSDGECVGGPAPECDDFDACTDDSCNPETEGGCEHALNTGNSCNDLDTCTTDDACQNGECVGGSPLNCDDSNSCTDDLCVNRFAVEDGPRTIVQNELDSCVHEPTDDGTTTCGLGVCEHTIDKCVDGATQACDPFLGKTEEVCGNGIDEDCDGADDECGELAGCIALPGNEPPVITFSTPTKVSKGVFEIPFSVLDPEGDDVDVTINSTDGNAEIVGDAIRFTVQTPLDIHSDGVAEVSVTVSDSGSCQQKTYKSSVTFGLAGDQAGSGCSLVR
ncbi:MAG TPA: hypothetical protein VFX30_07690 [bacterium]|nr:hypothetical protein [bacterium]